MTVLQQTGPASRPAFAVYPFNEAFLANPYVHHELFREGGAVARLEGELIAAELARQVRSIRLVGEPVRRLNNTLHAIAELPVEVVGAE
jgi:hypothetical protein